MTKRVGGFDLLRTLAILCVFLGHVLNRQSVDPLVLHAVKALTPGLTMSVLGFLSAALLSSREVDCGVFLVKRITRIFVSLWICLTGVLFAQAVIGKISYSRTVLQHTILQYLGMGAIFDLLSVENAGSIGQGLWFISTIVSLYLLLPLMEKVFRHRRRGVHLVLIVFCCTLLSWVVYGSQSIWNVVISFSLGVYLSVNNKLQPMVDRSGSLGRHLLGAILLLALAYLSAATLLPHRIRTLLFVFYPLAFVPIAVRLSDWLPVAVQSGCSAFAVISYEFYILHFYFINDGLRDFCPWAVSLPQQLFCGFILTTVLALGASRLASLVRDRIIAYALATREGGRSSDTVSRVS